MSNALKRLSTLAAHFAPASSSPTAPSGPHEEYTHRHHIHQLSPTFFLPRKALIRAAQAWAKSSVWLMKVIVGTRVEYRGLANIPPGVLLVTSS